MPDLAHITLRLDELLDIAGIPDYPPALNGLQFANRGTVTRIAAAVDFSGRTIEAAARARADLLIVHHGMYWGGLQRIVGRRYDALRRLVEHDIAVYAAHLPLDRHPDLGNNVLLARALGLEPRAGFGRYQDIEIGVRGEADFTLDDLVHRAQHFAAQHGGLVRVAGADGGHRVRRWAIITGAGASSETIREAASAGIDTLIAGEGPHHTAVEAADHGIAIVYAGHYATETLGVQAVAELASREFDVPWSFLPAPTGL